MAKLDQTSITAAALRVIESDDHGELTLSAIARELDVTQPALYYHVDGIGDIMRWVGIAVRARLVETLSAATIGVSEAPALRAVADAWRTFSQEHPALYQSTNWYPVEGNRELEAAVGQVLGVLAGSLRAFDLSEGQRTTAALALRSMLHGFVSFELGAGNPAPLSADDTFAQVIDLLLTSIHALSKDDL